MKIIAIGRNYSEHIKELGNETPDEPVVFMKPDTALLKNNAAFYHPEFSQDVHHEVEVIVRIAKEGKFIAEKFADKYYDKIGLGIDFTARDLQNNLRSKGLPWELAKAFNSSAPVSEWIPKEQFEDVQNIDFKLEINGEIRQEGNTSQMIHSINDIICFVSKFISLRAGDIIFTGTPSGVGAVKRGDVLKGYLQGDKMLDFSVK